MTNDEFIQNLINIQVKKVSHEETQYDMYIRNEFSLSFKNEVIIIHRQSSRIGFLKQPPSCGFRFLGGTMNYSIKNDTFDLVKRYFIFEDETETLENLKRELNNEIRNQKIKQLDGM